MLSIPLKTVIGSQSGDGGGVVIPFEVCKQKFPLLSIGRDSYIVSGNVNSTLELSMTVDGKRVSPHNIHIGNHVSIAMNVDFCVGSSHDYKKIFTGNISCIELSCLRLGGNFQEKGQILIQNDVWLGHSVTVMAGVTICNGAVVAANSHVVKDVPPYAIVGGNPAKVIRYRFSEDIIRKLLTIKWWNWSEEKLQANRKWLAASDVNRFCEQFYDEALQDQNAVPAFPFDENLYGKRIFLFFLDIARPFSCWQHVFEKFLAMYGHKKDCVLLTVMNEDVPNEALTEFYAQLENANRDRKKIVVMNNLPDERSLFSGVDFYITNRDPKTILRSEYCLDYKVKILSAVDECGF